MNEYATKKDLQNFKVEMDSKFVQLETKFENLSAEFKVLSSKFDSLASKFESLISNLLLKLCLVMTTIIGAMLGLIEYLKK
jgi:hypothetical protein